MVYYANSCLLNSSDSFSGCCFWPCAEMYVHTNRRRGPHHQNTEGKVPPSRVSQSCGYIRYESGSISRLAAVRSHGAVDALFWLTLRPFWMQSYVKTSKVFDYFLFFYFPGIVPDRLAFNYVLCKRVPAVY